MNPVAALLHFVSRDAIESECGIPYVRETNCGMIDDNVKIMTHDTSLDLSHCGHWPMFLLKT
jgi:hypothetical protein